MGRAFLVYFNQVYPDHSYVCRACRKAYIALPQDLLLPEFQDEAGNYYAVFLKVVNVEVEEPIRYRQVGPHTVADIYCVSCGSNLGFKYIQIGEEEYFMHGGRIENGYVQILTEMVSVCFGDEME
ncbi:hypothetical protein ACP275_04G191700 [Erythranthe tilingii]